MPHIETVQKHSSAEQNGTTERFEIDLSFFGVKQIDIMPAPLLS